MEKKALYTPPHSGFDGAGVTGEYLTGIRRVRQRRHQQR